MKDKIIQAVINANPISSEDEIDESHFQAHIASLEYELKATRHFMKEFVPKNNPEQIYCDCGSENPTIYNGVCEDCM